MATMTAEKSFELLEGSLKKHKRFSVQDAVALTGVEINEAKRALDKLMEKYVCRLQVTEQGDLVYDFGKTPLRRGEKTWSEYWKDIQKYSWKAFVILFKIWITVTLVVYFILFLLILIGLIVAALSGGKSGGSSKKSGIGDLIGVVFRLFLELFYWKTITGSTSYTRDKQGYPYRTYKPVQSAIDKISKTKDEKPKKNFISSVFDFVFGQPRVEIHPLANHLEVATYLREQQGIIVLSEMKSLAGWTTDEAQKFFSDCIVRFGGESKVSDNAVFYGDFTDFIRKVSNEKGAEVVWYWDEYEPEYKLTGNTVGRNVFISFMCLFNLIFSGVILYATYSADPELNYYANLTGSADLFTIILGWVPFIFSFLFFLTPLMRYFKIVSLRRQRSIINIRKRLMKAIYQNKGNPININYLQQVVNQSDKGIEKLSKPVIEKIMKDMIYDWYGEMEVAENADVVYKFPVLQAELQEAEQLRRSRPKSSTDSGKIVFDTVNN
jgi:hypothetical protein